MNEYQLRLEVSTKIAAAIIANPTLTVNLLEQSAAPVAAIAVKYADAILAELAK